MERKMKVKESKLKIGSGGSKALSSYLKSGSKENDGVIRKMIWIKSFERNLKIVQII